MRLSQRTARWLVAVLSCLFVAGWCGCGGPDAELKEASDEGLPPEAVAVRQAFESAHPSLKNPVMEALNLVKAGKVNPAAYGEALPQLQRLASNPTLTPEQKQALEALVLKLRSDLSTRPRQ
jgi:hypothetical protein